MFVWYIDGIENENYLENHVKALMMTIFWLETYDIFGILLFVHFESQINVLTRSNTYTHRACKILVYVVRVQVPIKTNQTQEFYYELLSLFICIFVYCYSTQSGNPVPFVII